ncbi:ATP-binding protein [Streptomyces sp. NEAU-YJ-81]|uniref:ATP-binding protein n=1 Tax=Streptomyces sp. NEAU-YJ-81 TaxID=2820288 RepID=UPI001ABC61FB|nr:ATP-binding protein [Streptomyces sp. NEAU-YJ-81]MBO3674018.1 sensor histidine kinase [Streptomyces sp. NEAU-YJ-81]
MNEDEELIAAVEALLSDPRTDPGIDIATVEQAARAVGLLDEGLQNGPGVFRLMAEGGQRGAETLSSDRLQVLSEMVQNADDTGASQVRFIWRPEELLIAHDGKGVRLADILLLGLPWLSGKSSDAEATGRFGIGLATLRALATTWEVHCHPYHVRFADLSIRSVEPLVVPEQLVGPEWTVFRIPLPPGALSASELFEWFETWNDSSLLFLRHVRQVEALSDCSSEQGDDDETPSVMLKLSWAEIDRRKLRIDGEETEVRVREARTTNGALWRVYDAHVAPHGTSTRRHKAVGASMPVAVALPVHGLELGSVHAGLPVAELRAPARVHAQFDPVVSREGFAASRWNADLVPLVADLWAAAALDVLNEVEPSAWHLVLLPLPSDPSSPTRLPDSIRAALVDRSRNWLASQISLPCPDGTTKPLSALAVEEPQLSGVLDDEDIARLAGLRSTFPRRARDGAHQWREVLTDWRSEGTAELADEVRVRDALISLDDIQYDIGQTIRLAAVAIEEDLDFLLRNRPCVIDADGRRLWPTAPGIAFAEPQDAEPRSSNPLDALGIVVNLHADYAENSPWARRVLDWLRKQGCLVRRDDTAAVLSRIVQMGRIGSRIGGDTGCGVEQLVSIQAALGEVSKKVRERLGPGIGKALLLDGYVYDSDGNEMPCKVPPAHAYLPQVLESTDGDRLAVAAGKTPGIKWVQRYYTRTLLSQGQCGLSRTAFLRLLGVADIPRLKELQPGRETKSYEADSRIGLARDCWLSPAARTRELRRLRADYTLDDRISPDLDAVVQHIVSEQNLRERRRRTAALLHTLGRPGMVTSSDHADVQAAEANRRWIARGQTAALWVWRLRETAWLEDTSGKLCTPAQVHLSTRDSQALYGHDDPGYLHPAIQENTSSRIDVLAVLGVNGDPDVPQLINRLRELRKRSMALGSVDDRLKAEVYLVYQALAGRLRHEVAGTSRSELRKRVRDAFNGTDFVLTDKGWQRAAACFRGPTILRGFRPFTIPDPELNPLWEALWIEEPRPEDLADVLKEIAQSGTQLQADQQRVMLEALRSLADAVTSAEGPISPGLRSKLRWLPLRTTRGWTQERPVYAVDHPAIVRTLGEHLHVWQPGGHLQQFTGLLGVLKVHKLETAVACVVAPDSGRSDQQLTEDFRWAVTSLQDTLVRDEPAAAEAFKDWAWLTELEVRVMPGLRIRLNPNEDDEVIEIRVDAHVDREAKALFVDSPGALRTARGGGLAVASLFAAERAHVGHRWRDLWEEDWPQDAPVTPLVPSGQQDHEERVCLASQLQERELSRPAGPSVPTQASGQVKPPKGVQSPRSMPVPPASPTPSGVGPQPAPPPARRLVPLTELQARTPQSTRIGSSPQQRSAPSARSRRVASLPQPRQGGAAPSEYSGLLGYQDRDKEKTVLALLAGILDLSGRTLEDQRGVQRLGADAVDSTGHFYEIKAHGGAEPADVSLTSAELTRALAEGSNYSLVIASNLEEGRGTPMLRIITDPLRFFEVETMADVKLKSVRDADADAAVWQWPDGSV